MVETYFTPGPWTVGSNNPDGDDPYGPIPIRAKHYRIAKLGLDDAPVHDYNTMQRCNARLIAAAPDLYESLTDFMENPAFQTAVGGNPIAIGGMMARARAALAKARGEQ